MPTLHELFELLEISENATPEEIKQARDRLAKKWHPDKNNNSEESKIKFQKIQEAYETLSNSQKRNEFNDLSAQRWLDSKFPKQQFSNQGSSTYTTLDTGKRIYSDPSEEVVNPRLDFFSLNLNDKNLEGPLKLESFANLKSLDLSGNKITSLDLEGCPNLRVIKCDNNPITSLKFISGSTKSFNPFTIEVLLSQDELIREKKVLSEQVSRLEEEKDSLAEQIVKLKSLSEGDQRLLEMQIGELKEKNKKQEDDYHIQINKLKIEYNKEIQQSKVEFERELDQERSKSIFLANNKKTLEKNLGELEIELQRLKQSSLANEKRMQENISSLQKEKDELQWKLASSSKSYQLDLKQASVRSSSLEKQNSSLQEKIIQLETQLKSLKTQRLEEQKVILNQLIVNLKGKVDIYQQDKLDSLLEAQDELNRNNGNLFVQKHFEKVKGELTKKLSEEEITYVLTKKEEVWKLQLEFINEPFKAVMELEADISKSREHFEKLLNVANDKLKKSKKDSIMGKSGDYKSYLEEFLNLQALIVYSDNKQEICGYLLERQLHLKQKILTKKKLDEKELEEIRLVKEELTKLEIQKSVLVVSNSSDQQEFQSQIQILPVTYKKF